VLGSPLTLGLILLAVAVVVAAAAFAGRRTASTPARRSASSYRGRPSRLPKRLAIGLMVGAVVFLGLAFTQFRLQHQRTAPGTAVLTLDVSESMSRTDVAPSRLEAAQAAALAFLDQVPQDLPVGLATFATDAEVLVPPTTDRSRVRSALSSVQQGEGTVIGDGLSAALDTIEAAKASGSAGPAAVVLLSDGRDTGSTVSPEVAAERARTLDVKVYTVVLGQASTTFGANVVLMQQIADTTEASTYSADTASDLVRVFESLGSTLSTEVNVTDYGAMLIGVAAILAFAATGVLLVAMRPRY
jgi:Ca-activated chloride channel family protein